MMDHREKRLFLIDYLLKEQPQYADLRLPSAEPEQRMLLRSLLNIRPPGDIGADFLRVQDEYLQEAIAEKGVTSLADLQPREPGLYLWQGDITTLSCDAIVNAANSGMTGCYQPCHNCIDNCIHTYAGVQLRLACAEIISAQGCPEPTGQAKITPAYNLPSKFVIHTVGPIVQGQPIRRQEEQLASCYRSCLDAAAAKGCQSIAFCCISTGVFGFPQRRAAEIAVETVRGYRAAHHCHSEVIFNVFTDSDLQIYRDLLG